ncbi:Aste57867_19394 [Aphanomyces stellatus]|uniref:Aste57867_19394 protein n=1 Tax=Aphanomyces stellatus TaxID=120398 RepID=A0A485LD88_9STRA|nr:hypothetical protein As57867_019330 [Aphanomyces stellatus]VFT96108.1 Aste57867_19394 [Aphanomyces stellatus]
MSVWRWWCGSLEQWIIGIVPGAAPVGACLETTLFVSSFWKLGIVVAGIVIGTVSVDAKTPRSVLPVVATSLCLLNVVCGGLYLGSQKPLYPCQVYAGTLWLVEGLHSAIILFVLPHALRRFRHWYLLDMVTRLVVFYSLVGRGRALRLGDINMIVDTTFLLLRAALAYWAHWRHCVSLPRPRHPQVDETKASFVSSLFFLWIWPLLSHGYRTQSIKMADLPPLHPRDAGGALFARFQAHWRQFPRHGLVRHLHAVVWPTFYHAAALMVVATAANIANPLLLHALLDAMTTSTTSSSPMLLAALWFLALACNSLFVHQFWAVAVRCGMHTRSILQQFVFEKSLRLASHADWTAGAVQSLLAVDACRLCDNYVVCFLHWNTWAALVTLAACQFSLFRLLSYSSFVWLAVVVLYAPCAVYFGGKIKTHSQAHQAARDDRATVFTQILRAALTMKACAYEAWSEARIQDARAVELTALQWKAMHDTLSTSLLLVAQVLAPMLTFLAFIHLQHRTLDAATAFSALAWFNTAASPLLRLPQVLVTLVDASVSLDRLERFFRAPERETDVAPEPAATPQSMYAPPTLYHAIEIQHVTCSWSPQRPLFQDLTLVVPKGQFVACYGAVGAGKSSFLELCLRLPSISHGNVATHGTIAYCPQTPWIQNTSVRDNILFGLPMDRQWYKMTLHMCALEEDIALWPLGDATIAGEQGNALSGGQKQRVSLARAIYSRRSILLLDDVLASLDAHVGAHIFQRCLASPTLAYTTKILVVNQPTYLQHPSVDRVLYFEESVQGHCTIQHMDHVHVHAIPVEAPSIQSDTAPISTTDQPLVAPAASETTAHGALDRTLLRLYLTSLGSSCAVGSYALLLLVEHGLVLGATFCLGQWSTNANDTAYQSVYIALGLAQAATSLGRKASFVLLSLAASSHLHASLAHALMHASMRFFDTHAQGMLLNRCVKDIAALDETIPYVVSTFLYNSLEIVMSLVSVAATTPFVLVLVLVVVYPYAVVYNMYRWPARDLKRLQSAARSPILSYFNEIAAGTSTVVAFDASDAVARVSMAHIDHSVRTYWPSLVANQWVTVWLEMLGIVVVVVAVVSCVWLHAAGRLSTALIGLVLTYAAALPSRIGWMLKMLAAIEVEFVALERIHDLTTAATVDADAAADRVLPTTANRQLAADDGCLHIDHLSMNYGATTVLRDIHVDVPAGAKVAVVGRTGAGKSSLVRALLGLYPIQGSIRIGDIDLASLPPAVLRQLVLGFVPQDALFLGRTVWEALVGDAYDMAPGAVDAVLVQVGLPLDHAILHTSLADVTFSGGEMQLLCLARALLRPGRVLVCDEATAFVDAETDETIHRLLFQLPRTVLTICHRVHHLLEYDLVLVLDKGHLVECGAPADLQANYPKGIFASLVAKG